MYGWIEVKLDEHPIFKSRQSFETLTHLFIAIFQTLNYILGLYFTNYFTFIKAAEGQC